MDVRRAGERDIDELARLRATWRERTADAEFLTTFRAWFVREQADRWWWIAVDGPESVGMVNVKLFDRMPDPHGATSRWGYLANLFVVPPRRGEGVGASLVAAVLDRARAEGLVRVVLSPSERSIPLYRRHGFEPATDLLLLSLSDNA